jgi:hypothetical protein
MTDDLITETTAEPTQGEADGQPQAAATPPNGEQPADLTANENTADLLSDDESGEAEGVPESYTFEPPEGVELNDATQAAIVAFGDQAKELGLTQSQYQSLIEYDLSRSTQVAEQAVEGWNNRVQTWRDGVKSDRDIGGDKLPQTLKNAEAVLKQFGDAELRSLLRSPSDENPTGLSVGNHPAILRMLNRVGKALSDPAFHTGNGASETVDRLEQLYPSMSKQR